MTVIIQTAGFDLEDELERFIKNCLHMLPRLPVKITDIKIVMGKDDLNRCNNKFCHQHIKTGHRNYNLSQCGNSYEETILSCVKESELNTNKTQ